MAIIESEAVLLKKMELRETSLILDLYTKESGRIKGVIKGVRSPQPQFGALFEPFTLDRVVFYEKKNKELFIISKFELVDYYPGLRRTLDRFAYASYYTELIEHTCGLCERNNDIYELLTGSLKILSEYGVTEILPRIFEIKLLRLLGFMPQFGKCVNCREDCGDSAVRFSIKSGGVLCEKCIYVDRSSVLLCPGVQSFIETAAMTPIEKTTRLKVSADLGKEVERFLKYFLDFHIQKSFKSVEFMNSIDIK